MKSTIQKSRNNCHYSSKMCYLKYFEKKFRAREENEETRGDKAQETNQTFWRNNLTVMHGINQ